MPSPAVLPCAGFSACWWRAPPRALTSLSFAPAICVMLFRPRPRVWCALGPRCAPRCRCAARCGYTPWVAAPVGGLAVLAAATVIMGFMLWGGYYVTRLFLQHLTTISSAPRRLMSRSGRVCPGLIPPTGHQHITTFAIIRNGSDASCLSEKNADSDW